MNISMIDVVNTIFECTVNLLNFLVVAISKKTSGPMPPMIIRIGTIIVIIGSLTVRIILSLNNENPALLKAEIEVNTLKIASNHILNK